MYRCCSIRNELGRPFAVNFRGPVRDFQLVIQGPQDAGFQGFLGMRRGPRTGNAGGGAPTASPRPARGVSVASWEDGPALAIRVLACTVPVCASRLLQRRWALNVETMMARRRVSSADA